MSLNSPFLQALKERGFINQCTDLEVLDDRAANAPLTAYVGFDCTAPSLHVGNLISIMMLRWWQEMGHRPIVLLGGATTRIGDPSGKEETRKLLTEDQIEKNIRSIKNCFQRFLRFDDSPNGALLVNNRDWLNDLKYIDFLRDYGRHFSLNRMLNFDSVKLRLEEKQNLSFLEFNYMVFQAYDFLELFRRHDCVLQMGGADQWGNIINGVELAHKVDQQQIFGLTTSLITTESGQKMGKTASGAVWLDASMTSPSDYWQFWRNVDDKDVKRFLKLFTNLSIEEINELETTQKNKINNTKKILANEATALLHGKEGLEKAHINLEKTNRDKVDLRKSISFKEIRRIKRNLPDDYNIKRSETLITLLIDKIWNQTNQLEKNREQIKFLNALEKQTNRMKEIQEQTKRLDDFKKQIVWLKESRNQPSWLEEFLKQEDWLKKFQKQVSELEKFQKQVSELEKFEKKVDLLGIFQTLQKQADLLSTLQKQKNLLNNLQEGMGLLDTLRKVGLADSNSEARRFVRDGAVRINGKVIKNEKYILTHEDSRESDGSIHLSIGKKRHHLLHLGTK